MSSEPPEKPEDRPAEPFTKGRIQWSRPPQPVFRVGPLPRSNMMPQTPMAPRPAQRPGGGILTGSMIPPARHASAAEQTPEPSGVASQTVVEPVVDQVTVEPVAVEPEPVLPEPVLAEPGMAADPAVDPVPEPKRKPRATARSKAQAEPDPASDVEAVAEAGPVAEPIVHAVFEPQVEPVAEVPLERDIVVEPEVPEPAVTVPPPLSSEARPAAEPRAMPSVVVTPAIYATVGAAIQKAAKNDRWLIVVVVLAVLTVGGFVWLATLPGPAPIDQGEEEPALAYDAVPIDPATPIEDVELSSSATASPTPPVSAPAAASSTPAAREPVSAPRPAAPLIVTPPAASASTGTPRPYIETSPLVVEVPTPATAPPSDPEAPIATRPQPLD